MTILLAVQVLSLTSVAAIGIYTTCVAIRGDNDTDNCAGSFKKQEKQQK